MNITLLCGNGLDLALRLKTSYADFFSWWCHQFDSPDVCQKSCCAAYDLKRALLRRCLRGDRFWSDLERSLGVINYRGFKCLKGRENALSSVVMSSLTILASSLKMYLESIQDDFRVPQNLVLESRRVFLSQIIRSALSQKVSGGRDVPNRVKVSFVTLNYTDTIEKLLGENQSGDALIIDGHSIDVEVGPVIHAHGDLQGTICFGLDSIDQLTGTAVNEIEHEQLKQLSKKFLMNGETIKLANAAIEESDLIMTYGVSWGDTDKSWWLKLFGEILKGKMLCACEYCEGLDLIDHYRLHGELRARAVGKILMAMLGCSVETTCTFARKISERIYVPSMASRNADGIGIKSGDYLGLDAIAHLLENQKKL